MGGSSSRDSSTTDITPGGFLGGSTEYTPGDPEGYSSDSSMERLR